MQFNEQDFNVPLQDPKVHELEEDDKKILKQLAVDLPNVNISFGQIKVESMSECSGIFIGVNFSRGWKSNHKSNTGMRVQGNENKVDKPSTGIQSGRGHI